AFCEIKDGQAKTRRGIVRSHSSRQAIHQPSRLELVMAEGELVAVWSAAFIERGGKRSAVRAITANAGVWRTALAAAHRVGNRCGTAGSSVPPQLHRRGGGGVYDRRRDGAVVHDRTARRAGGDAGAGGSDDRGAPRRAGAAGSVGRARRRRNHRGGADGDGE